MARCGLWIQGSIWTSPITRSVTLDKTLNLSESQFADLKMEIISPSQDYYKG